MLWSALQATQLIHIDMEVATGLKAVQDIFTTSKEKVSEEPIKKEEEENKITWSEEEEEKGEGESPPVTEKKNEDE